MATFRDRLLATLRAVEPILGVPGVLVAGSQLPNLLQPDAAALTILSLLPGSAGMPDPKPVRATVARLLELLEGP